MGALYFNLVSQANLPPMCYKKMQHRPSGTECIMGLLPLSTAPSSLTEREMSNKRLKTFLGVIIISSYKSTFGLFSPLFLFSIVLILGVWSYCFISLTILSVISLYFYICCMLFHLKYSPWEHISICIMDVDTRPSHT